MAEGCDSTVDVAAQSRTLSSTTVHPPAGGLVEPTGWSRKRCRVLHRSACRSRSPATRDRNGSSAQRCTGVACVTSCTVGRCLMCAAKPTWCSLACG